MIDRPAGPAALRLSDAVTVWAELPYGYELQKPKAAAAALAPVAETFKPDLEARDRLGVDRGREVRSTHDGIRAGDER